jgi:ubiquinone/menaquinone biosynthesis C-methylase UbiE/DNA-binding HxlR family transcriptional regulator
MAMLDTYKALADESRLRVVRVLSLGYFNVQELTAVMDLSQSTVSHHLKVLHRAGITRLHREGTWAYYSLTNSEEAPFATATLQALLSHGESKEGGSLRAVFIRDRVEAEKLLSARRDHSHRFFESVAEQWHELRHEAHGHTPLVDELVRAVPNDVAVLDLGCGSGALLELLLPRAGKTIGVDYSPKMLEEARSNLGAKAAAVDLRLGYLEHLPLGDSSIDLGLAYMVLHHVPSPEDAMKDAFRVLRPGGALHIIDLFKHDNEYMRERFADLWLGFDQDEIVSWAQAIGFSAIEKRSAPESTDSFYVICTKGEQE